MNNYRYRYYLLFCSPENCFFFRQTKFYFYFLNMVTLNSAIEYYNISIYIMYTLYKVYTGIPNFLKMH